MNKIKIINPENTSDFFEIPWKWISINGLEPNLEDVEAKAERGVTTAYLYRDRAAEVPTYTIKILKQLKQSEIQPLLKIIRKVKLFVNYFDPYENNYVQREFYIPKPHITIHTIPKNNNTDNIIYNPFDLVLKGYGDVKVLETNTDGGIE